jgi:hypothetical protein
VNRNSEVGRLKILRADDHLVGVLAEAFLQAVEQILAEIVVLVEHRDLRLRVMRQQMPGIEFCLVAQIGLPAHGPGEMRGIVQRRRAGGGKQLRHAGFVEVRPDRHVERRAEHAEHQRDLVAFHQAAHILHRLGRRIAVVAADESDLAAVDAALGVVQPFEIGRLGLAEHAIGRGRPAVSNGLADLDLGIADAGAILLLRQRRRCQQDQRRASENNSANGHEASSQVFLIMEEV